ncbi:MAG TPA: VWA domain-containing protein, partial [Gammaproteobacteria bacterium]|nr:VWA domain-containing protein [Gammaproteobacteria bacterium]
MTARRGSLSLKAIALAVCSLLALPAWAQIPGPDRPNTPPEQPAARPGRTIQLNVELALVNVTVTDPYNRLVTGLEKDNFRAFEDGVEQEIVHFSSEDVPISIGVIFDMSGSMSNKVDKARQAAVQFLRTANPSDEFFLVSFNDRAEMTSPFTSSVEEIQNRMMYTSAGGRTALFDGIYLGLSQMRGARNGKRALLVVSDGGDNHSRYSESDVRNFLKEADCQLYAIGVYDSNDMARSREERYGPTLLAELAEMTGGRAFPVSRLNDLPDIAAKIGRELRNQYVLGYKPGDTRHDGAWRKIRIRLELPRGLPPLNVYAKTG